MYHYIRCLIVALLLSFSVNGQVQVSGIVFEDSNNNRQHDPEELGLSNVVVSDQESTVITDKEGKFNFSAKSQFPYINISLPSGYSGTYYYPSDKQVNFPLKKTESKNRFKFIHASDTHIDSLNIPRMAKFRAMTDSVKADFIIITGDLIRDALRVTEKIAADYYQMYVDEIKKFSIPVFSGVGNHEIFGIERDKSLVSEQHPLYGKNMFRKYLGPNYYSFNYGGIHFVSVDAVDYQNLYYFGGVDSLQLKWLENDLKYVPKNKPVVTFNHIPFISPGFTFQNFESHLFYGPQLLQQNSKLEHRHIVYNYDEVKTRIGNRPYPLALSGHYHAAQQGQFTGTNTLFAQTAAITRPDVVDYNGFTVRSGFTVYEVENGAIVNSSFIPLQLPD